MVSDVGIMNKHFLSLEHITIWLEFSLRLNLLDHITSLLFYQCQRHQYIPSSNTRQKPLLEIFVATLNDRPTA